MCLSREQLSIFLICNRITSWVSIKLRIQNFSISQIIFKGIQDKLHVSVLIRDSCSKQLAKKPHDHIICKITTCVVQYSMFTFSNIFSVWKSGVEISIEIIVWIQFCIFFWLSRMGVVPFLTCNKIWGDWHWPFLMRNFLQATPLNKLEN